MSEGISSQHGDGGGESLPTHLPSEPRGGKFIDKFYTAEWLFALLSLGFTFGWSVSGFKPHIELTCVCWGVCLAIALHYFWVFSIRRKLWAPARWGGVVVVPVIIVLFAWRPVYAEYKIQHASPRLPEFEIYINHERALSGHTIRLGNPREVFIQVYNVGNATATGVELTIQMPLAARNIAMPEQWKFIGETDLRSQHKIHTLKGFNCWKIDDPKYILANGHFNATAFTISSKAPLLSRKEIARDYYQLVGGITNTPSDLKMPIIPCTVSVSSLETERQTTFLYLFAY